MLKLLWGLLLVIALPISGHSQVHRAYNRPEPVTHYMLKGGWQLTSLAQSNYQATYGTGWCAGVATKLPLRGRWWLQPEVLYSRRRTQLLYPAKDSRAAFDANYIFAFTEIPVLLVYRVNDVLEFQLGPRLDLLINNKVNSTTGNAVQRLTTSDLKRWDYAVTAGVEINVSPLAFGARYSYGLLKLENTELARQQLGGGQLHGFNIYGLVVF